MKLNINNIEVNINLQNGYYMLEDESACGKTYLGNLLKAAKDDRDICVLDYNADFNEEDYIRILDKKSWDIVLCDNFMLYNTKNIEKKLIDISSNAIVLIDIKQYFLLNIYCNKRAMLVRNVTEGREVIEVVQ